MSSLMVPLPQIYGTYALETIAVNNVTTDNPSWLHKDPNNGVLYCLNEGLTVPNGSISSFKIGGDGSLNLLGNVPTINGPVGSVLFNQGKTLAAAHYGGSGVSTHNVQPDGTLKHLQTLTFNMTGPGPVSDRQDKPHPHQAILDPSEQFIVVPDLGADLVRIFSIDPETALLTEQAPYKAPAAAVLVTVCSVKLSLVTCITISSRNSTNKITSFEVTYNTGKDLGLTLTKIDSHGIYGNRTTPAGAAAAACLLSPDGRHILTTSRNATILSLPQPPANPQNKTSLPSDTVQTWTINAESKDTPSRLPLLRPTLPFRRRLPTTDVTEPSRNPRCHRPPNKAPEW
ncbi:hypothetical protein EYC84_000451 [Monilinia fructicola]|uniref:Uncharacterized protein n=1 Tax=Monilinia fructicola TaxID=38448 RepID=A0A5M9JNL1_MONFR|nr:hypothetical protein EYC84_000451 [Monilinia fructicola]